MAWCTPESWIAGYSFGHEITRPYSCLNLIGAYYSTAFHWHVFFQLSAAFFDSSEVVREPIDTRFLCMYDVAASSSITVVVKTMLTMIQVAILATAR